LKLLLVFIAINFLEVFGTIHENIVVCKDKKAYTRAHFGPQSQDNEATYGARKYVHVYS
jgi:hypothetical protein